jgi:hypothetical protein
MHQKVFFRSSGRVLLSDSTKKEEARRGVRVEKM